MLKYDGSYKQLHPNPEDSNWKCGEDLYRAQHTSLLHTTYRARQRRSSLLQIGRNMAGCQAGMFGQVALEPRDIEGTFPTKSCGGTSAYVPALPRMPVTLTRQTLRPTWRCAKQPTFFLQCKATLTLTKALTYSTMRIPHPVFMATPVSDMRLGNGQSVFVVEQARCPSPCCEPRNA